MENTSLNSTERQDTGFGSTNEKSDFIAPVIRSMKVQSSTISNEPVISDKPIELPYNIFSVHILIINTLSIQSKSQEPIKLYAWISRKTYILEDFSYNHAYLERLWHAYQNGGVN